MGERLIDWAIQVECYWISYFCGAFRTWLGLDFNRTNIPILEYCDRFVGGSFDLDSIRFTRLMILQLNQLFMPTAFQLLPITERKTVKGVFWFNATAKNFGSSRFRGVTTTCSVWHSQITAYLRHQAKCAGIADLSHISHSSAA